MTMLFNHSTIIFFENNKKSVEVHLIHMLSQKNGGLKTLGKTCFGIV